MGNPFSTPPTKGSRVPDLYRSSPTEAGSFKTARAAAPTPANLSAYAYNARSSNKFSRYSRVVPDVSTSASEAEEESSQARLRFDDGSQSPERTPTTIDIPINPHGRARGETPYGMFSPSKPTQSRYKPSKLKEPEGKYKSSSFLEGIKDEAAYRSDHVKYAATGMPTTPPMGPILEQQMSRKSDSSRTIIEVDDKPGEVIDLTQSGSSKRKSMNDGPTPSERKLKKKNKTQHGLEDPNKEHIRQRYGTDVGASVRSYDEAAQPKEVPGQDKSAEKVSHIDQRNTQEDPAAKSASQTTSPSTGNNLTDRIKQVIAEHEVDIATNLAIALEVVSKELKETPGVTLADIKREFDVLFADASKQRVNIMANLRSVFLPGM